MTSPRPTVAASGRTPLSRQERSPSPVPTIAGLAAVGAAGRGAPSSPAPTSQPAHRHALSPEVLHERRRAAGRPLQHDDPGNGGGNGAIPLIEDGCAVGCPVRQRTAARLLRKAAAEVRRKSEALQRCLDRGGIAGVHGEAAAACCNFAHRALVRAEAGAAVPKALSHRQAVALGEGRGRPLRLSCARARTSSSGR